MTLILAVGGNGQLADFFVDLSEVGNASRNLAC